MQVIQSQNSFDPLNSKPRPINRLLVCLIPIFAVWVQYVLLGRMYREHNSENINTKCLSLSAWCLAFNWASSGWPPSNPSIYNICNTLVRWADGENDSSTKHLMFQALFFFITSCKILCKKPFQLIFLFFKKITEIKSFECSKSIRSYEKKILGASDTWWRSCLSYRPSEPAFYIADCRISALSSDSCSTCYSIQTRSNTTT